jgi:protein-S-isoprenylcysteine O-methyltransferase Ste14
MAGNMGFVHRWVFRSMHMLELRKRIDPWSQLVIVTTLVLFIAAVVTKGMTHDILLEAAVFLVSVKLILMAYRNNEAIEAINQKLDKIYSDVHTDDKPE